jgi:hypothetical protein
MSPKRWAILPTASIVSPKAYAGNRKLSMCRRLFAIFTRQSHWPTGYIISTKRQETNNMQSVAVGDERKERLDPPREAEPASLAAQSLPGHSTAIIMLR